MMKPVRRIAAFIYLSMIIVVLAIAIAVRTPVNALHCDMASAYSLCWMQLPNLGGLVLFLVFIQFLAAVWYGMSLDHEGNVWRLTGFVCLLAGIRQATSRSDARSSQASARKSVAPLYKRHRERESHAEWEITVGL